MFWTITDNKGICFKSTLYIPTNIAFMLHLFHCHMLKLQWVKPHYYLGICLAMDYLHGPCLAIISLKTATQHLTILTSLFWHILVLSAICSQHNTTKTRYYSYYFHGWQHKFRHFCKLDGQLPPLNKELHGLAQRLLVLSVSGLEDGEQKDVHIVLSLSSFLPSIPDIPLMLPSSIDVSVPSENVSLA